MESNNMGALTLALAFLAVIIAAGSIVMQDGGQEPQDQTHIYRFNFGCGDADDATLDQIRADIKNIVCNEFHSGYTLYDACGASWIDGNPGFIATDASSLVLEVAFMGLGEKQAKEKADAMFAKLQTISGITGILKTQYSAPAELFIPGA